jgi:hypothetical protein
VTTHNGGLLHNPIGYLVSGASRKVLFNKPLSSEVLVVDVTNLLKRFKRKDKHFFLQCRQHNYIEAEARIVSSPYFFITDANGSFQLGQVPGGKYKVTTLHAYSGEEIPESGLKGLKLFSAKLGEEPQPVAPPDPDGVPLHPPARLALTLCFFK